MSDRPRAAGIYARLGVRTYVDLTATESIHGGAPMLPEVRRAMAEAADGSVVIDELMARVGERIAGLLGVPAALVTSGAAGALTAATCACVAGGDPERAVQLPDLDGMRDQVVMPVQSRTVFDQTIRAVGVRLVRWTRPRSCARRWDRAPRCWRCGRGRRPPRR